MREILFKGKRINDGKWIYGYFYCHKGLKFYSIFPIDETPFYNGIPIIPKSLSEYEVEPNTVSQFTGLCDKNGTKIFEGDILKVPERVAQMDGGILNRLVGFDKGAFMDARYGGKHFNTYLWIETSHDCEVIGNVYDNPNLIVQAKTNN